MKTENRPISQLIELLQKIEAVEQDETNKRDNRPTLSFDPFEYYAKAAFRNKDNVKKQGKALRLSVDVIMNAVGDADKQERLKVTVKSIKGTSVTKVNNTFVSNEGILFFNKDRESIFPIVELGKLGDKVYLYPNKLVAVDSGKTGKVWVAIIK